MLLKMLPKMTEYGYMLLKILPKMKEYGYMLLKMLPKMKGYGYVLLKILPKMKVVGQQNTMSTPNKHYSIALYKVATETPSACATSAWV